LNSFFDSLFSLCYRTLALTNHFLVRLWRRIQSSPDCSIAAANDLRITKRFISFFVIHQNPEDFIG